MRVGLTFEEANAGRAEQGRGDRRVLKTLEALLIYFSSSFLHQAISACLGCCGRSLISPLNQSGE